VIKLSSAQDYFPIISSAKYIYKETGNEFHNFTLYTDYTNNKKQQFRITNGETEIINIYKSTFFGVKSIYSQDETYYRENFLGKTHNRNDYILLNPVLVGRHWTISDGNERTITNIDIPVETPYRTFPSALETTTINGQSKIINYFAKSIGLVKTNIYSDDTLVSSYSLKEINNNTPLTQTIRFFYPDYKVTKVWYIDKNIKFFTNDLTKIKFENGFKNPPKYSSPCIGPNTTINYLYYNEIDHMVYVDFSANLVNDLSFRPSYELQSLLSITNTIGRYYNEPKVYITIDGNPYYSHHIQKQLREPFLTNFNNINELILS
jgi:hypothetical protein